MELKLLDMIQGLRNPVLDKVMPVITSLGNAGAIWILLTLLLLLIPKTRRSGWIMALALCADVILCNGVLKNLFMRIRPCDVNQTVQLLIARPSDFSFPSGHTAASFAAVAALYLAEEKLLFKGALALAVLIAFSRLYLYVHYPTDVLGGMAVGIVSGYLGYWAWGKVRRK